MSNSLKFVIPLDYDELWLIGFRIDPDQENYDFLTVIFSGDIDQPLTIDGYIVFFNEIDVLSKTLELVIPEVMQNLDVSEFEIVDLAAALYLIDVGKIDDSAIIVNTLNILIDLVKATRLKMFNEYKPILYQAADRFTFSKEISAFFDSENVTRKEMLNIITWCIGSIVSKSKILTKLNYQLDQ